MSHQRVRLTGFFPWVKPQGEYGATNHGTEGEVKYAEVKPISEGAVAFNKKRIALVEDDSEMQKMLEDCLSNHGYRVTLFTNCSELSNFLAKICERFDAVIVDLDIPPFSGLCEILKIKTLIADVPLMLISGTAPPLNAFPGQAIETSVKKPIHLSEFLITLRDLIEPELPHLDHTATTATSSQFFSDRNRQ